MGLISDALTRGGTGAARCFATGSPPRSQSLLGAGSWSYGKRSLTCQGRFSMTRWLMCISLFFCAIPVLHALYSISVASWSRKEYSRDQEKPHHVHSTELPARALSWASRGELPPPPTRQPRLGPPLPILSAPMAEQARFVNSHIHYNSSLIAFVASVRELLSPPCQPFRARVTR